MKTQPAQTSLHEETIINIIRRLPSDRVSQLIDFAKFLENQSSVKKPDGEDAEDKIHGDEEKWNELFACPEAKQVMREMANEAIEDYHAGKATEIGVAEDGRLKPL